MYDKSTPEIEIDIDIEKDIDKEIDIDKETEKIKLLPHSSRLFIRLTYPYTLFSLTIFSLINISIISM